MRYLDTKRIASNMAHAVSCLAPELATDSSAKSRFLFAINRAQGTTIRSVDSGLYVEFDNPALVDVLVQRTVFAPDEVTDSRHLLSAGERRWVEDALLRAQDLIAETDRGLHRALQQLIGSVAAYRIGDRDGGSVSCCLGLIWLSPRQNWSPEYWAEMLVHEFVHNAVFLEDMIRGVLPTPALLDDPRAHVRSALRQTRRPYDKAFHSACVAAALMYFYHSLGNDAVATQYLKPLRTTVAELVDVDRALQAQGLDVLADNGRQILTELDSFVGSRDYSLFASSLAT